jgi:putative zinc finger/helix-turn-helix YgiT family protein
MITDLVCRDCHSSRLTRDIQPESFSYRSGGVDYPVNASYHIYRCLDCGETIMDADGEDARHDAICKAMGRLTPREILTMRKALRLSQREFADLSGLGEASIGRWEAGELIQSESNDNLLRLLSNRTNLEYLKALRAPQQVAESSATYIFEEQKIVHIGRTRKGAVLNGLRNADAASLSRGFGEFRIASS